MSQYIIIDNGYSATLGKRQEDGSYKELDLSEKGALAAILEEIANDGSVSEVDGTTEPTLNERQVALEKLGYVFDAADTIADITIHRDVYTDEATVLCGSYTRTEAIEAVEEYNNGRI